MSLQFIELARASHGQSAATERFEAAVLEEVSDGYGNRPPWLVSVMPDERRARDAGERVHKAWEWLARAIASLRLRRQITAMADHGLRPDDRSIWRDLKELSYAISVPGYLEENTVRLPGERLSRSTKPKPKPIPSIGAQIPSSESLAVQKPHNAASELGHDEAGGKHLQSGLRVDISPLRATIASLPQRSPEWYAYLQEAVQQELGSPDHRPPWLLQQFPPERQAVRNPGAYEAWIEAATLVSERRILKGIEDPTVSDIERHRSWQEALAKLTSVCTARQLSWPVDIRFPDSARHRPDPHSGAAGWSAPDRTGQQTRG